jgi:hypothetical protein
MNVVEFYIYDDTGEILRTGNAPVNMVDIQAGDGETAAVGSANDLTQYVLDGVLTDKPEMPIIIDKTSIAANGTDLVTITGVPSGALVQVGSLASGEVMDGELYLSFDEVGEYEVTFSLFPYLDYSVKISAT